MTRLGASLVLFGALAGFLSPVCGEEPADGKDTKQKKHVKTKVETQIVVVGPDGKKHTFHNANDPALRKLLGGLPGGISVDIDDDADEESCEGGSCEAEVSFGTEEDDEDCGGCEGLELGSASGPGKSGACIVIQGPDGKKRAFGSHQDPALKKLLKGLPFHMPGIGDKDGATFEFEIDEDEAGGPGAPGPMRAIVRHLQQAFEQGKGPKGLDLKHLLRLHEESAAEDEDDDDDDCEDGDCDEEDEDSCASDDDDEDDDDEAEDGDEDELEERFEQLEHRLDRLEEMLKKALQRRD